MLTLQSSNEVTDTTNLDDWSDEAMWRALLEGGEARSQRATISNMLEYMPLTGLTASCNASRAGFPVELPTQLTILVKHLSSLFAAVG
jgi:hypothetical protein